MDVSDSLGRAVAAAKQGDLDGLEVELGRLRNLPTDSVAAISVRLRAMARCVRSHPAYRAMPHARAS